MGKPIDLTNKSETISDSLGKYIKSIEDMSLQSNRLLVELQELTNKIDKQLGILKILKEISTTNHKE